MSDIHYTSYDPNVIWEEMTEAYREAGGETLFSGDEKEMLLRGVQSILINAFAAFDYAARMRTLEEAEQGYLDALGDTRGVARIPAEKAKCTAQITMEGGGSIVLEAGTVFTKDGIVFYETENSLLVSTVTGEATAQVILVCTVSGEIGNRLNAGDMLLPVKTSKTITSVLALSDATGGREQEDDDSYRERVRYAESIATTTGTELAYRTRALSVSANIRDAKAIREAAGIVGVYLLFAAIIPGEQKPGLISAVQAALNAYDARPLCDIVRISEAEIVPYKLVIGYSVDEEATENVLKAMQAAISEYRAWQEGSIGIAFDPFRLVQLLYNAGAARIEILEESFLNVNNPAEYTKMGQTQALHGSVALRAIT